MKPRNHIVIALIKSRRKSGSHTKSNKAQRRKERVQLLKSNNNEQFTLALA